MLDAAEDLDCVAEILALPPGERLSAALDELRKLTGRDQAPLFWVMSVFGLGRQAAQLFVLLNACAPNWVPAERLAAAMRVKGKEECLSDMHMRVVLCRMRKQLRPFGITIETVHGALRMPRKVPVAAGKAPSRENLGGVWTPDQDRELARMLLNGSHVSAVAEELGRTERAVLDRWRKLRGRTA